MEIKDMEDQGPLEEDVTMSAFEVLTGGANDLESIREPKHKERPAMQLGQILLDIVLCTLIAMCVLVVPLVAFEPPYKGFFCSDKSLWFPYKPDSLSKQIFWAIVSVYVTLPPVIVEGLHTFRNAGTAGMRMSTKVFLVRVFVDIGSSLFGILMNLLIVTLSKCYVGGHRPHFLEACFGKDFRSRCTPLNNSFTTDYNCTEDLHTAAHARTAFFSARASISMHAAFFAMLLVQARFPRRVFGVSVMLKAALHLVLLCVSLVIGYMRIMDNMGHPADVFVGFVFGILTAWWSAVRLARVFKQSHEEKKLQKAGAQKPRRESVAE